MAGTTGLDRTGLDGSVALITGGGRGIGRMAAVHLADAGVAVGLVSRSAEELATTVALIEQRGGTARAATADVTDARTMRVAVAQLRRELGPFDLLLNNAGVVGPIGPAWEIDLDAWWQTMEVNLRGVLVTTQLVLPEMVERGRGRVLNMASHAGAYRWPMVSAYSVSKAAVVKLTENLAHETSRHGVAVFSVHPGLLPIGLTETGIPGAVTPSVHEARIRDWLAQEFDAGRGADPSAAMQLIMRLCAGDADLLSGRHVSVHDDLDAILDNIDAVWRDDLYVMRPERLAS